VDVGVLESDVLIIGAGGAGLRAALEAAKAKARVTVLSKGPVPGGATSVSGGVIQAAVGPDDSPEQHFRDTVIGGRFVNNQRLVHTFVTNAPQKVLDLERYGCAFDRKEDGSLDLRMPSGATRKRGIEGEVNSNIQKILTQRALENGARIDEFMMVTRLLTDSSGRVCGATALDFAKGIFIAFLAKTVILATGAAGRLYEVTACPRSSTGDGIGLARQVGARFLNLEMMQFIPLAYTYPEFIKGFTLGEAPNYGHHTRFRNSKGERFMLKYDSKRAEYTTRDVAARAGYIEVKEGRGSPHGGIWVDTSENDRMDGLYQPHKLADRYQMIVDFYGISKANFDEPFEATPSALFLIGGVEIDSECRTNVAGLFAAGEVAANLHGANRLGANALAEIQVFGSIAGINAAQESRNTASTPSAESVRAQISDERSAVLGLFEGPRKRRPHEFKREIQRAMWNGVGVVREGKQLQATLDDFRLLKEAVRGGVGVTGPARRYNYEWVEALEIPKMLDVAEMMAASALSRTESRGAHYRTDFPNEDDANWLRETVVQEVNGKLVVTSQPVDTSIVPIHGLAGNLARLGACRRIPFPLSSSVLIPNLTRPRA
jgi:succinate dehydrogenase/fumarate reductase flavoprotein subunit